VADVLSITIRILGRRLRTCRAVDCQAATEQAAQVEAARLDNLWLRSLVRRLQDSSQLPDAFRQYEAKLERAQRREEVLQAEIRRQRREATQLRAQGRASRPVSPVLDTAKPSGTVSYAVSFCCTRASYHAWVEVLVIGVTRLCIHITVCVRVCVHGLERAGGRCGGDCLSVSVCL
jgi:hypothetical protein